MSSDDIVERLADEIDSLKADPQVLRAAIDEIKRLRAAGDALVESLEHSRSDIRAAVAAWQEARREQ